MRLIVSILMALSLPLNVSANRNQPIKIEVVEVSNMQQSEDARGSNVPGAMSDGGILGAIEGRRNTLTDAASMKAIINGEHVLLDCYEHHKGCMTLTPGTYDGVLQVRRDCPAIFSKCTLVITGGIWIEHQMPLSHVLLKEHYVARGSW